MHDKGFNWIHVHYIKNGCGINYILTKKERRDSMFKSEMATRVKQIIVDNLNISESEVTLNTNITKDLGASSFDLEQLVSVFEKEFGVTFSNEQATSIVSVGDFLPIIETNLCIK